MSRTGTPEDPWVLETPPGTPELTIHRDVAAAPRGPLEPLERPPSVVSAGQSWSPRRDSNPRPADYESRSGRSAW